MTCTTCGGAHIACGVNGQGIDAPSPEDAAARRLAYDVSNAVEDWGKAMRQRYECGGPIAECGGVCNLFKGHNPPCLCSGDTDGPGSCQA